MVLKNPSNDKIREYSKNRKVVKNYFESNEESIEDGEYLHVVLPAMVADTGVRPDPRHRL